MLAHDMSVAFCYYKKMPNKTNLMNKKKVLCNSQLRKFNPKVGSLIGLAFTRADTNQGTHVYVQITRLI